MGKDRISLLIGNYRLAAIKKKKDKVHLEMGFVNNLPESFKPTGFIWRSIPNTIEGYTTVEKIPFSLPGVDLKNFIKACNEMLEVAPKSRRHICNVTAIWSNRKDDCS